MRIYELTKLLSGEKESEDYLREKDIIKTFKRCPFCESIRINRIRRNKIKCYECNKEWSIKRDSIFEKIRISFSKFIYIIKLFELEMPALRCAKELKLSRNTVNKIYIIIRKLLIEQSDALAGEIEMDESYFGGRHKGKRGRGSENKVPVFGILEREGKVQVEVVEDVKSETLLELTIKKVKRGSLIYTDKYKSYDGLVSYGFKHERIDHSKRFANGKVYINGIEGFWSYAKQRLLKFHGVSKNNFKYYLKEMEFRYNNRTKDLFDIILNKF